jgi:anti-anti-sigma factor
LTVIARRLEMEITTRDSDGKTVAALSGSLDTTSAPEVGAHLEESISAGAAKIIVDLTGVEFVSSAGLRILLVAAKKLRASGGDLGVCGLNETVQEVFDMSGFSTILKVFPNSDEALERI